MVAACKAALYAMFIRQSALKPSAALSARSRSMTARRSRISFGLVLWPWSYRGWIDRRIDVAPEACLRRRQGARHRSERGITHHEQVHVAVTAQFLACRSQSRMPLRMSSVRGASASRTAPTIPAVFNSSACSSGNMGLARLAWK
jgi:hypothetical protein